MSLEKLFDPEVLVFLIGGLVGNPGCELTAIPNLVLRPEQRVHCT